MIDALEPRSFLSAAPTIDVAASSGAAAGSFRTLNFPTLALKATTTSIKVYSNASAAGEAVTIAAAVAGKTSGGTPTGIVAFLAGSTLLGNATLGTNGVAKLSTAAIPIGTTSITAVYGGSSRFAASTSPGRSHLVTATATTAKLSVTSAASTVLGDATTLLARVAPVTGSAVATGRVAFYDGGTLLASKALNSLGAARLMANYLYVGSHAIKAIYLGSPTLLAHRTATQTVTVSFPPLTTESDGLKIGVVTQGTGNSSVTGDILTVNYTEYSTTSSTKIESSLDTGQPISFQLGGGRVIQGFDEGLLGAKAGEKRVLVIPADLAYGMEDLVFVVDVISVTPTN